MRAPRFSASPSLITFQFHSLLFESGLPLTFGDTTIWLKRSKKKLRP